MASAKYPIGMKAILDGDIDFLNDDIRAVLIDSNDVSYNAAHDFYNDISAGAIGSPTALSNKSTTGGVFDADDTVISSVTGDPPEVVVLIKWTGTASTSNLIAWIEGITVTPNGGNITIQWDNGSNKIFAL